MPADTFDVRKTDCLQSKCLQPIHLSTDYTENIIRFSLPKAVPLAGKKLADFMPESTSRSAGSEKSTACGIPLFTAFWGYNRQENYGRVIGECFRSPLFAPITVC